MQGKKLLFFCYAKKQSKQAEGDKMPEAMARHI
jgi:hypothetical protein